MYRAVLQACLPWLALLLLLVWLACAIVRLNRARPRWDRLLRLHRDEAGAVQSLSFVLTLPFFILIMLFIVQVSQLMIAINVVHYAAYAAARSACVWIPAQLANGETANCISLCQLDPDADQAMPALNPKAPDYGPRPGGTTYVVLPGSPKYDKIAMAAALACMPISPSRAAGCRLDAAVASTAEIIKSLYGRMAPDSYSSAAAPRRLDNKLAYAIANTSVEIRFYHPNDEPPLMNYLIPDAPDEFRYNELGWQDRITVKVRHDLALLPGPARFLAGYVLGANSSGSSSSGSSSSGSSSSGSSSSGSSSSGSGSSGGQSGNGYSASGPVEERAGMYVYPLEASITMGNEGEKPVVTYVYGQN
jgi:uncharacterized membrane protein YgcG